jgi:ketosteroid isomerase-like protein
MSNLPTVQDIYAAFGRGDVPFILDKLAPDVEWERGSTSDVPWLVERHGREGVEAFFQTLSAELEFLKFAPYAFMEGDNIVAVLVDLEAKAKRTGSIFREDDETHVWRFDEQGRVTRFNHKADTHAHWKAYHTS